jgi:hypothetical protein
LNRRQPKPSKDLPSRMTDNNHKLAYFVKEIEQIKSEGEIAPPGCWIVRYQARGRGGCYWYYKWMAAEKIFVSQKGQHSSSKYIGKAGSEAYLKAVEMLYRRGQIEAMERAIKTLSQGLEDLVEEATRFKKD